MNVLKHFNSPSNAEATFVSSTRMQRFLNTIQTLSCWYSLDSSQMTTYMPGFLPFLINVFNHFVLAKLATSSIRVKF